MGSIIRITFAANGHRAVWIDDNFKMRVWDKSSGKVETLEALMPLIKSSAVKQANLLVKHGAPFGNETIDPEEMSKTLIKAMTENPAMIPFALPLKISEDGSRALLVIGSSLRLYDLLNKRMLKERSIEDFLMVNGVLLSQNGKFLAAWGITWESHETAVKQQEKHRGKEPVRQEIQIRVYPVDQDEPMKTIAFSFIPMKYPIPIPGITPLGIGPQGRRLVVEKLEMPSKSDAGKLPFRKVTVMDVGSGQPGLELFSEPFTPPHPMDFAESLKTKMAAFSKDGRFLAFRRTELECPTSTVTHPMTMMPMHVPTCPDMKVKYTVWNLRTQQQSFEIENMVASDFQNLLPIPPKSLVPPAVVEHSEWTRRKQRRHARTDHIDTGSDKMKAKATKAGDVSTPESIRMKEPFIKVIPPGVINMPGMPGSVSSAQVAFTLDAENSVKVTRMVQDPNSGGMVLITETLSSSQKNYIEEACRRMDPKHREFSPEQWASQFPGADFHPICTPGVPPQ